MCERSSQSTRYAIPKTDEEIKRAREETHQGHSINCSIVITNNNIIIHSKHYLVKYLALGTL